MTDNGIGENDEYEKVTMYQCIWCGKLFKTDRLHKCKFSPKMCNCFSCRHCRGVDEITVRPFDNETRDSNELERLKIHCRQREQELKTMESVVSNLPANLAKLEERKLRLEQDYQHFIAHRESLSRDDRNAFGEEALDALRGNFYVETERWFDDLHGFRILLPAYMKYERPTLLIEGISGNRYDVDMRDAKPGGCIQRVEHILSHLNERMQAVELENDRANAQAEHARAEIKKGNSYTAEVVSMSEKLLDIDEELNSRANENEAA